jgi:hypothetical protein
VSVKQNAQKHIEVLSTVGRRSCAERRGKATDPLNKAPVDSEVRPVPKTPAP